MKRTSLAAAIAALFLFTASDLFAQAAGTGTASGRSGANAAATGSTTTGAAVPGPTATDRAATPRAGDTKSTTAKLDRGDRKFLEEAAEGGLKEVEFGRVASDKATDPAVKAFAERMVKDHSDANKKLMDVAQSKGVTPPPKLKASDQRTLDRMSKKSGADFDRAYMDDMVKDHKKDVKDFEKQASKAKDTEVKNFASNTLPVLQEHLKLAEDTQGKLKGGGSPATRATTGAGTSGSGSPAAAGGATASAGMGKDTAAKK